MDIKLNLKSKPSDQTANTEKREMKDKLWISALGIEIMCVLLFPIYTMATFHTIKNDIKQSHTLFFSNYYNFLWLLPLPIILLSYLYLCLICAIRSLLFQIFLFVNITSLVFYSTSMIVSFKLYGLLVSAIPVGLLLFYFFSQKKNIKLATLTTKAALEIFSNIKGRLILRMSSIIPLFGSLFAFFVIASLMLVDLEKFCVLTGKGIRRGVLYSLLALSVMGLLFLMGACMAVLYLFGAALFNQRSLQDYSSSAGLSDTLEKKKSREGSQVFCELAEDIAFRSSLGVACFGSVIISLVRMLGKKNQDYSVNSSRGVNTGESIMSLIFMCLQELVCYLTSSAYIYSALYGTSLIESGMIAWKSYKNKGWERYFSFSIVDNLLGVTSALFCFTISLVAFFSLSLLTVGISFDKYTKQDLETLINIGVFSGGLFIALTVACLFTNQLVEGASTCQLSIYVEDPLRFENTYSDFSKFKEYIGDTNE